MPRTTNSPTGTVVPAAGSVIVTLTSPAVKRRCAAAPSLPARSRALTSKRCEPGTRPDTVTRVAEPNADQCPPSTRHANARLATGVRLSPPVKSNVAASGIVADGPPVIRVSGGVLSTMTLWLTSVRLPARSMATASSVCAPSATPRVFQVAVATADGAGNGGVTPPPSRWAPTPRLRSSSWLRASLAWAATWTAWRTKAPAPGAWKASEGETPSCVSRASAGAEVRPRPAWPVASTWRRFSVSSAGATDRAKRPVASATTTDGVPPFRTTSRRAEGSVVPPTASATWFVNAGSAVRLGGGGARNRMTRPERPSAT